MDNPLARLIKKKKAKLTIETEVTMNTTENTKDHGDHYNHIQ